MLRETRILTKLELVNIFGINVFKNTKDKKAKTKALWLSIAYILSALVLMTYIGLYTFGLISFGLEDVVPHCLVGIISIIVFMLSIFKCGSVIFKEQSYDILTAMPIKHSAIVLSRFIRIYIEELVLSFLLLLPGFSVYAILEKPAFNFYIISLLSTILIPLIPISMASLIGIVVKAISARMKHKNIAEALIMMLFLVGIFLGLSNTKELDMDKLEEITTMLLEAIEKTYPMAVLLGDAIILCSYLKFLVFAGISIVVTALVIILVCCSFDSILNKLRVTSAKHNYKISGQNQSTLTKTLVMREFRRYFGSSVYMTNTIIGPILCLVLSIALLIAGTDKLRAMLPHEFNLTALMPFMLAFILSFMTTTAVSISLEGKTWWILKTMPISSKDIFNAKILMHLALVLPFYLLSEVILVAALKPKIIEALWLWVIPVVFVVFSDIWGITANIHFVNFDWDSEVSVVKQSMASFIGGALGSLVALACMVIVLLKASNYINIAIVLIVSGISFLLYKKNNNVNLKEL